MAGNQEQIWERLGAYVTEQMARTKMPGVAVGVLHNGKRSTAGFGITNVDHPLAVTGETLFQIGSITKTFTATLIMQLVEEEKVALDATVRTYLPDFAVADGAASAQVTVRHLLTHMAGWEGDFFHDTGSGNDALARYVADMADLPQLAPLATAWSYNNAGFAVLGRIIEVVTDSSYAAVLHERLLKPLGMERAYLDPGDVITHRFAAGHRIEEEGAHVSRPWPLPHYAWPMGGIVCHVQDLLRYAHFHLGDGAAENGERLLQQTSLAQMQSVQVSRWGEQEAMGLAWFIDEIGDTRQISHSGGTNGQIALLALVPRDRFAIAMLTNANRGGEITRNVRRWVLAEYLGLAVPLPAPQEAAPAEVAAYVGRYSNPFSEIELGLLGGRLVGQVIYKKGFPSEDVPPRAAPPPFALDLYEPDRLLVLDGPMKDTRVDMVRKADGSIGWLRMGRLHVRAE